MGWFCLSVSRITNLERTRVCSAFDEHRRIQEDYRSIEAQVKLLDWCMFNGQWLGKVNPTTVSGFKSINDAKSAAYAFEMNFERPASAHPERQNYAQSWYNKLHGLTSPEPGGISFVQFKTSDSYFRMWMEN